MLILDLINSFIHLNNSNYLTHLAILNSSNSISACAGLIGFMSFKRMGKGATAGGYYIDSAGMFNATRGVDDYYMQAVGTEPKGTFFDPSGTLLDAGITDGQEVSVEAFQRLLAGRDPHSGDALIKQPDDAHVSGFDCTMSVPKNISALWAVSSGEQRDALEKAMADANNAAMRFLSDKAGMTRRGKGGVINEHVDLIASTWPHSSSREGDPQRHFHNTVFNVAKRADGTWGTIESKHLMQWQTVAGAIFRAALAENIKREFPGINITNNEKTRSFDIDDMPEDLLNFWSKRTNEINNLAKEAGATSQKQIDIIKLEARKNKSFEESTEDLQARWKGEADTFGFTAETLNAVLTQSPKEAMDPEAFKEMMDAIPGELIEMDSTFTEQQLFRRVAEMSAGLQGIEEIQATVDRLLARDKVDEINEVEEVINVKELQNDTAIRAGIKSRIAAGIDTRFSPNRDGSISGGAGLGKRLGSAAARGSERRAGGFINGGKHSTANHEPNLASVNAVRARRGFTNSLRTLSESGLARNRSSKSAGLLRDHAQPHRRSFDNLRRNVSSKPSVKAEVVAKQIDPQSVVIAIGVDKEGRKVFSTLRQIQVELSLKKLAGEMANDGSHKLKKSIIEDAISKRETMSEEQAEAVRHAFSPGSLKVIEGAAGAGKSFSLDAVREAYESQGYKMQGIALSWQAASVLQESAGIESRAITGFLADVESGKVKLDNKTVIVCDENGLVGSVYGQKILKFASEAGAKIIITGDEEQLNPVQAGPAMKIMKMEAGSVKISEIRRQKELWMREMVFNFSKGNSRDAIGALVSRGKVHLLDDKQATISRLASDFYTFLKENRSKSALALGGSNEDTKNLNIAIRELKRQDGLISPADTLIKTEFGELPFAISDKVMFRKNDKSMDVINRQTGNIMSIDTYKDGYQLHIRLDDGRNVTVDSRKYKGEDGFLPMHHGDAMTVYSSQGMTVDQTFVMHSGSMDRRLAYVGYSRHREDTQIYVDKSAAVTKMQSNLAADEYKDFKPTDAGIIDAVAKQYHGQTQKISTLDYLSEARMMEIINAHTTVADPVSIKHSEPDPAESEQMKSMFSNVFDAWDELPAQEDVTKLESAVTPITTKHTAPDVGVESAKASVAVEFSDPEIPKLGLMDDYISDHVMIVESEHDYEAIRKHSPEADVTIIVAGNLYSASTMAAIGDDEAALLQNATSVTIVGRNLPEDADESAVMSHEKAIKERVGVVLTQAPHLKDSITIALPENNAETIHEAIERKKNGIK